MKKIKLTKKQKKWLWGALLLVLALLVRLIFPAGEDIAHAVSVEDVPAYSGHPYAIINDGKPLFTEDELVTESYEYYGQLDSLGRCTVTMACVGRDLMPTEDRGEIGRVKPTGWVQNFYDHVDGGALYNRCHLIGFQLTGENANKENLITGTRYMNVDGMLPFENEVAEYIKEIRDTHNLTIFLIEHHMDLVMKISDYIYVIDFGSEIARGVPKDIQQNKRVIDAYLGVAEDE